MTGSQNPLVLIVDDELAMRRLVQTTLGAGNYRVTEAEDGNSGLIHAATDRPDIILLDLNLPDLHGLEVLKRLREWFKRSIVILSVVNDEETIVKALDIGADDYLTKPFGAKELLARIRVCMRHQQNPDIGPIFQSGDLIIDLSAREVKLKGERVKLTVTEYDVLRVLVTHAGKAITHGQMTHQIWGPRASGQINNLRVIITRLRQKLEADADRPTLILTEPGVGYRLANIL